MDALGVQRLEALEPALHAALAAARRAA